MKSNYATITSKLELKVKRKLAEQMCAALLLAQKLSAKSGLPAFSSGDASQNKKFYWCDKNFRFDIEPRISYS